MELSNKQAKDVKKPKATSATSIQAKAINNAAPATQPKIPFSHGANARSHAIVVLEESKTNLLENVAIVVDMLLTKTCVQREEKPVRLVEKLVILLMFADQNLELWPP